MEKPVTSIASRMNANVVETLEQVLEQARSGKIKGVYVLAAHGNETYTYKGGTFQRPRFVFALELAKLQILDDAIHDGEPPEEKK